MSVRILFEERPRKGNWGDAFVVLLQCAFLVYCVVMMGWLIWKAVTT
jgi:hypothetical protein